MFGCILPTRYHLINKIILHRSWVEESPQVGSTQWAAHWIPRISVPFGAVLPWSSFVTSDACSKRRTYGSCCRDWACALTFLSKNRKYLQCTRININEATLWMHWACVVARLNKGLHVQHIHLDYHVYEESKIEQACEMTKLKSSAGWEANTPWVAATLAAVGFWMYIWGLFDSLIKIHICHVL